MLSRIALLVLLISTSLTLRADDVYRWVDENGKTHYGHVVPEKYKQGAKVVDTSDSAVTDAQRSEALERNASEKAKLDALQQSRASKAGAAPASKPPAQAAGAGTCEERLKAYNDSMACFDKYRTIGSAAGGTGAGVRPEAFKECPVVQQPQGCLQAPASSDRTYLPPAPDSR